MIDLKKLKELGMHQSGKKLWIQAEDVVLLLDQLEAAQKDAARYQWLMGARSKEQASTASGAITNPLPQDRVLHEMQCFFFHKQQADEMIDAAMASKS